MAAHRAPLPRVVAGRARRHGRGRRGRGVGVSARRRRARLAGSDRVLGRRVVPRDRRGRLHVRSPSDRLLPSPPSAAPELSCRRDRYADGDAADRHRRGVCRRRRPPRARRRPTRAARGPPHGDPVPRLPVVVLSVHYVHRSARLRLRLRGVPRRPTAVLAGRLRARRRLHRVPVLGDPRRRLRRAALPARPRVVMAPPRPSRLGSAAGRVGTRGLHGVPLDQGRRPPRLPTGVRTRARVESLRLRAQRRRIGRRQPRQGRRAVA